MPAADFASADPAYAGTMVMTWEVAAAGAGMRVNIVAGDVPEDISADDHAAGLTCSLANLAYVAQEPCPPMGAITSGPD